jgi:hypothetical protein
MNREWTGPSTATGEERISPAARVAGGQLLANAAYQELARILDGRGMDHLLLKGPHLGATVYDDPSQRAYCDLDVLVRARQFEEALAALRAGGFRFKAPMARRSATQAFAYDRTLVSPHGWIVEIHRASRPTPVSGRLRGVVSRAEPFRFGPIPARGLAPEDLLVHLVIHAAKSQFWLIEPKHVRDVALLVARRPLQWAMFERLARAAGCSAAAWVLLAASAKIHGAPIPEEVLRRIRPAAARRGWLGLWLTHERFPLLRRPGLPGWLRRLLLAPALIDSVRHGVACGWRFAIIRIRDRIGRPGA